MTSPSLLPADEHNRALLAHAHPPDWQNPRPAGAYNLVVIGGGTAGLISAIGTAGLGGRVALVERHLLGGDCLNYGCVPSKALLAAARAAHDARRAATFGVRVSGPIEVDFAAVMERMRRLRAHISQHDAAQRLASLGIDVFLGEAHFTSGEELEVAGERVRFRRCIIASGGRPKVPNIPGLAEVGYLTNETIFSLTELPRRLLVMGGGPVGCELAQAFRRFGSDVMIVQRGGQLLPREEPEAAAGIHAQLVREGIQVLTSSSVTRVERATERSMSFLRVHVEAEGTRRELQCDDILVAVGRSPNVEGMHLDHANVEYGEHGVDVNDFFRTSNSKIFAAGDILGGPYFTHAADAMARACIQNAFFFGRQRLSRLLIPRTTYTDPEIASIGHTAATYREQRQGSLDTYREDLRRVDRAVLDGEEEGFALVHSPRGSGRVVGGTIVARHAGEMIGELSLLMTRNLPLSTLAHTIHCYPTQVEVLKRLGDQYRRTQLTPRVASWLRSILRWR